MIHSIIKFVEYPPIWGSKYGVGWMVQELESHWNNNTNKALRGKQVRKMLYDIGLIEDKHFSITVLNTGVMMDRFRFGEFFDDESFILAKLMLS